MNEGDGRAVSVGRNPQMGRMGRAPCGSPALSRVWQEASGWVAGHVRGPADGTEIEKLGHR